jgi:hypothetical protein
MLAMHQMEGGSLVISLQFPLGCRVKLPPQATKSDPPVYNVIAVVSILVADHVCLIAFERQSLENQAGLFLLGTKAIPLPSAVPRGTLTPREYQLPNDTELHQDTWTTACKESILSICEVHAPGHSS